MKKDVLLPEWAPVSKILLTWPDTFTDWAYMLPEVRSCYRAMAAAFMEAGIPVAVIGDAARDCPGAEIVDVPYNDTWIRDYGPLTLADGSQLDFGFNAWGLKFAADRDNLVNAALERRGILRRRVSHNDFVLEGGSVETDGRGTILTTSRCLLSPNRNGGLTREAAEEQLRERLGADRVLWLDHGALPGDDTDSHIDTLARMLPGDRIMYVGCDDPGRPEYAELKLMEQELRELRTREGKPYGLVRLPLPSPILDEEGLQLPATYANYLVANGHVFLPVYGDPEADPLAERIVAAAWEGFKVVPVDCRALIRQHGSLHCATMQLHDFPSLAL